MFSIITGQHHRLPQRIDALLSCKVEPRTEAPHGRDSAAAARPGRSSPSNNAELRRSVSAKAGPCTARAIPQLQLYPRPLCTEERQQSLVPQKQTNTDMQQQQEVFAERDRRLRRTYYPGRTTNNATPSTKIQ